MKFLIAGLGNIGAEYDYTRHNIGFEVLNRIAANEELMFQSERYASTATWKYRGKQIVMIKPSTYMNLSGKALRYWMTELKIPIERVLVVVDDKDLPFGKLRLRPKGSAAGHNGLGNIEEVLGTNAYPRLRFGIGNDFHPGQQVDYVLGKWSADEMAEIPKHCDQAIKAIASFVQNGLPRTMSDFNK